MLRIRIVRDLEGFLFTMCWLGPVGTISCV
jgi:hypothetical protein